MKLQKYFCLDIDTLLITIFVLLQSGIQTVYSTTLNNLVNCKILQSYSFKMAAFVLPTVFQ